MSLAIRMSNVSKRYRQQIALQDVTLEVPPGGVFALLGENGAGKTTAIRVLLGIFFSLFSSRPLQAAILGIVATSASVSALVYLDGNGRLIHTLPVYVNVVPMRLTIAAVMAEIDLGPHNDVVLRGNGHVGRGLVRGHSGILGRPALIPCGACCPSPFRCCWPLGSGHPIGYRNGTLGAVG